ncbi:MAG: RDD family protein [Chthoniobacteraceae bacterium]
MNSELRIQTPEGIVFSYPLAGPLVRCFAWTVDFILITALTYGASILCLLVGVLSFDFALALMILCYFGISIGYGVAMEWLWRGQTPGKRMMRLRVMDVNGLRLQFHQVLMRNLLRFVDMLPGFYAIGGAACLLNRRAQRLGDLAANTVVVHLPQHAEPDLDQLLAGKFNSLRQHPHLEARLRQRVSPEEARLALQALVRRDELEPAARVQLFAELAGHFKSLVTFPPESVEAMPDEQYVRNAVDILFRTRGADGNRAGTRKTALAAS